jgi:RNA methyltransferase, TrmH family
MKARSIISAADDGSPPPLSKSLRRHVRQLKRASYRRDAGETIIEGVRLLHDSVGRADIQYAIADASKFEGLRELLQSLAASNIPVFTLPGKDFALLSHTEHSQGILAIARWSPLDAFQCLREDNGERCVTVLSRVADPGNLGTIIRSCDWFGSSRVFLSRDSADPANPKVIRATMGSLFHVEVAVFDALSDLFTKARACGYRIAGTSGIRGTEYNTISDAHRLLLVFGGEAEGLPGVPDSEYDMMLRIPGSGAAESLNLAVAHGILLAHFARQRQ